MSDMIKPKFLILVTDGYLIGYIISISFSHLGAWDPGVGAKAAVGPGQTHTPPPNEAAQ